MVSEREQHFIGGVWSAGSGGGTFAVVNPASEEVIAEVAAGNPSDVDRAVAAAVLAQKSWGQTSGNERATFLRAIGEAIKTRQSDLARLEVMDNGKPLPEADWDIADAAGCFEFYAGLAEELDGRQGESVALGDERFSSQVYHEPIGPSGLIIPWNYPLLMAAWKVAPALAAGCACVLKPSELTPLTALRLGHICQEVGLPAGVLNIVTGMGPHTGAPLSAHRQLRKIAFTGSVPTGARVMAACAQDIKNVSLELGGKSPIIVFDDVSIEAAVEWIMFGIFWNQGQVCSATSRLLVQEGLAPQLLERLAQEASRIPMGDGFGEGVKLGPLVSPAQLAKVEDAVGKALAEGAKALCGGRRPASQERGYFYEPTVLVDLPENSSAWNDEIFGPVLSVRTFKTEAEAIARANDSAYGLAAAVMSEDLDRAQRVARAMEAGIVWINCSQPTFTEAPWGGMKESGIGRELGHWGLANYLEVKQVTTFRGQEPWGWYLGQGPKVG
jgi:betaine-aldehyde dehydrogenase